MAKKPIKKNPQKVAVVLFNLGGPDSTAAIKPFLMNFFMDKNIIQLPLFLRYFLAAFIANKRSKREAGASYGEIGGKSPLLENSQKQARALEKVLKNTGDDQFKTFVCMRYWHPMSPQIVREVHDWGADKIVILPLYPQFSTTTTWSSLGVWNKAMRKAGHDVPTSMVCCYPENRGFIQASAENVREQYERALKEGHEKPRILFSAHGLPESIVKDGDPYQWQCEESAKAIVSTLGIKDLDWVICYQSRVGPKKWIGPSTEEELERAAHDGKAVIIYPHAFTQEHVETLVELDIEYKKVAAKAGQRGYYRAQTVGTQPQFIDGLATLVKTHVKKQGVYAEGGKVICGKFKKCCMLVASKENKKVA